jgi:uncharacterized protein DUF6572
MTVKEHNVLDVVSVDPVTETVFLSLLEDRAWGTEGDLLPDLQAKLHAYLVYVRDGQLVDDYPELAGKPIVFRLQYVFEPGLREHEFIHVVCEQLLYPLGIAWEQMKISVPAESESN